VTAFLLAKIGNCPYILIFKIPAYCCHRKLMNGATK